MQAGTLTRPQHAQHEPELFLSCSCLRALLARSCTGFGTGPGLSCACRYPDGIAPEHCRDPYLSLLAVVARVPGEADVPPKERTNLLISLAADLQRLRKSWH